MAEALGLVVNIVGVVQLAQKTIKATAIYIKDYKSAPVDINSLRTELFSLVGVLSALAEQAKEEPLDGTTSAALSIVGGPLWLCNDV